MVGLPKPLKCDVCRKRKIKCDEIVPICGPCRRANRTCNGPKTALVFIDQGAKVRENAGSCDEHFQSLPSNNVWIPENEQLTNGHLLQRWHRLQIQPSAMTVQPQFSAAESLGLRFTQFLDESNAPLYAHRASPWLKYLPNRLGHSEALDAAVSCVSATYAAIASNNTTAMAIDDVLYGKALRKLQRAIADPSERYSTDTLLATSVLICVESCAQGDHTRRHNFLHHAGGCTKLIEARGPASFLDKSELRVVWQLFSSVIYHCLSVEESCYLASAEWAPVWTRIFQLYDPSTSRILCLSTIKFMTYWPSFTKDIRAYHASGCPINGADLLCRLLDIGTALRHLGTEFQALIDKHDAAKIIPSSRGDKLVPYVLRFTDEYFAVGYIWHTCYSLIVETMISSLGSTLPKMAISHAARVSADMFKMAQVVWMSFEYAWESRPLGASWLHAPLIASFSHANAEMKNWIIRSLNELDGHIWKGAKRYNELFVMAVAKVFTGKSTLDSVMNRVSP